MKVKAQKDKRLVGPFLIWLKFEHSKAKARATPALGRITSCIERPKICNFRPRLALAAPLNSEAAAVSSFAKLGQERDRPDHIDTAHWAIYSTCRTLGST